MEITTHILLWAFGLAVILGIVATKTSFCTMGAVSDWVNIGTTGRMRAWVFAIGASILGVLIAGQLGLVDMSLTASNDTANPPIVPLCWLGPVTCSVVYCLVSV